MLPNKEEIPKSVPSRLSAWEIVMAVWTSSKFMNYPCGTKNLLWKLLAIYSRVALLWVKVIFVSGAVLYQFTYSSVSDIYKLRPAGLIGTDLFTMKVGY